MLHIYYYTCKMKVNVTYVDVTTEKYVFLLNILRINNVFSIKISLLSEFKRSSYNYRHANQLEGLTGK